jgi:hypothetical protein
MTARWLVSIVLAGSCAALSSACADDDGAGATPTAATAFAVGTDFATTGIASTLAVPGLEMRPNAVDGVASTDPVVRWSDGRLAIVNRLGQDNITVLDPDLTLVAQVSTGPGSNPQDVAIVGDLLFVAALDAPGVLVLDATRPEAGVIDTIDLSDLDPDDGIPDCGTIAPLGDRLLVVCGILDDSFSPRGPGQVALIDPAERTVLDRGALDQIRPFGMGQVIGGSEPALLVPTNFDFADPAAGGCVERIAVAGDAIESGCLVDNADLGGFVSALAWDPRAERVWMTVTTGFDPDDFGPLGELVSVDATGADLVHVELAEAVRPMDLARCPTGHLVLSDATRGLRVFAPEGDAELTSGALDIGLPPVSNGLTCY